MERIGAEFQAVIPPVCAQIDWSSSLEYGNKGEFAPGHYVDGKDYTEFPKSAWSDSEKKKFVLGLYIYGKDFVKVQKHVESKSMGEVLTFYYGKCYKSDEHLRWVKLGEMGKIGMQKAVTNGTITGELLLLWSRSIIGEEAMDQAFGKVAQDALDLVIAKAAALSSVPMPKPRRSSSGNGKRPRPASSSKNGSSSDKVIRQRQSTSTREISSSKSGLLSGNAMGQRPVRIRRKTAKAEESSKLGWFP